MNTISFAGVVELTASRGYGSLSWRYYCPGFACVQDSDLNLNVMLNYLI